MISVYYAENADLYPRVERLIAIPTGWASAGSAPWARAPSAGASDRPHGGIGF
jgi:hypothetical protein